MEDFFRRQQNDPDAYVAMAQVYNDANRGAQAVKVLQDAQAKFPQETAHHLRARRHPRQAEEVRRVRSGVPAADHEGARERGGAELPGLHARRTRRAAERIGRLHQARAGDRARQRLVPGQHRLGVLQGRQARSRGRPSEARGRHADHQLRRAGSLRRRAVPAWTLDDAIAAWNRALSGDGDSIDRGDIDKKIRSAKQKLPRK